MKKIYGFLGAFALLAMASCTADEPVVKPGEGGSDADGRYAYINAKISLPTAGSRSATDDDGEGKMDGETNSNGSSNTGNAGTDSENPTEGPDFEYGYDYENDVRSMILVLADVNDRYLTHIVVTGMNPASTTGQEYTFEQISRVPYQVLQNAYSEGGLFDAYLKVEDGKKVNGVLTQKPKMNLYAFCNFTSNMLAQYTEYQEKVMSTELTGDAKDALLKEWRDFKGTVEEKASQAGQTPQSQHTIWSSRSFLMANAEVYTTEQFPATLEEWDQYADDRNPLVLTQDAQGNDDPIDVERVSARIDFRDASANGDRVYPILIDITQLKGENKPQKQKLNLYSVKLTRMSLVNMSKEFYYLRRVSDDGTMGTASNVLYAGKENRKNYVVDTDYDAKGRVKGITPETAESYFNFPLYNPTPDAEGKYSYNKNDETYGWYVSNIEDVLEGKDDNWGGNQSYQIWRYVTENTIPSIDQQKTVQSIGVIFKGALILGDDCDATYDDGDRYLSEEIKNALMKVAPDAEGNLPQEEPEDLPAIYAFQNLLYAGVPDIVAAAKADGDGGSLNFAVDQILSNWYYQASEDDTEMIKKGTFVYSATKPVVEEGETAPVALNVVIADEFLNGTEVTDGSVDYTGCTASFKKNEKDKYDTQFIALAPAQKITIYLPSKDDKEGWGYFCYYFYWNRHNDNGLGSKMGQMEFASVRNNVYKLAVTKINSLGHPRDTENDPDPVDPEDPDEEPERSIEVQVNVLPWVVRVNDIEF